MSPDHVQQAIELYNAGLSLAAVAQALEVSSATVRHDLLAAGIKLRKRGLWQKRGAVVRREVPLTDSERQRKYQLKFKFGMTEEDYARMLQDQRGVCKICGLPPSGRYRRLAVDHDHKTGKVRGLLCHKCNMALGWFEGHSEAAQTYLAETR